MWEEGRERRNVEGGKVESGGKEGVMDLSHISECGRQRTLIIVHEHTAAWLQSNRNLAV